MECSRSSLFAKSGRSRSKALDVTGGISEALISTATGLIVAVMALLAANIFRSLYIGQVAYIDRCCGQLELQHLRSHRQLSSQIELEKNYA
jgi:biopolymer transport protein ExbB